MLFPARTCHVHLPHKLRILLFPITSPTLLCVSGHLSPHHSVGLLTVCTKGGHDLPNQATIEKEIPAATVGRADSDTKLQA